VGPNIHSRVLDNGLVVVAEPMGGVETAAFTLRVPAGTAYERRERAGISSMACDLAMRGAGDRDSRRLVTDLDNLGVERGESVSDAHTSFGGATLAANLAPALAIFADVVRRPRLPDEELEAVRLTAQQELRAIEDEPGQKVMQELRVKHFPDPWGRPGHGTQEGLEAVTRDDVCRYVGACYRPNGAVLGIAGRIDWPEVADHVERLFGDWPKQPAPHLEERRAALGTSHVSHDSNQTHIGIAFESVPYAHPDFYQASGAIGVLSGGMSSRLFTEVREKRGLCYTVYATHHTLRDRGSVLCYAGTSAERAQETLDVTLAELVRLARGVEPDELARLKARVKSALIMQQESSSARSAALARDWYYLGRARSLEEVGRLVDALTCESINAFLLDHPPRDFTVVTLGSRPLEVRHAVS
jgi:predicted Zn-dependent peptidase